MDILLYHIDKKTVEKVEKVAKERGLSRNHYLRQVLEKLPYVEELELLENKYINTINDLENKYTSMLNDLKDIVRENTMAYKEVLELTKDLKELNKLKQIKNE